jgi:hypothetical protein
LLSILAAVLAAFMPLAATSQIFHGRGATPAAEKTATATKYEIFAGYGYTSLNEVDNSRNGLQGLTLSITRDWGKYFGLTADGGYYAYTYDAANPGNPTVDMCLLGPVLHAHIAGNVDGFFHVLLGGEHIAGQFTPAVTPKVSFAGGAGGGFDYKVGSRLWLRLYGDDIASSFAANANTQICTNGGCSAHERRDARASFGVVYKF